MLHFSRVIPMLLVLGVVLPACMGGTTTVRMTKSQDIPAAEGTVDVSVGENRNTRLRVDVRHLAAPSQVVGGATVYVVWIRGVEPAASPQNAGALVVDKDLNGRLETVTPLRNFDLYITAEASSMTAAPSGKQLLSAQISRK